MNIFLISLNQNPDLLFFFFPPFKKTGRKTFTSPISKTVLRMKKESMVCSCQTSLERTPQWRNDPVVEEPFAPVRAVFTREASFPSYYESKRKPTLVVSIPHPGKIQLPEQLKSLRRENLSALFHSLSRHMKLTGRSLRPRRGRGPTKRAPRPPNVALSRRGQSATRHDTSHHRVSVERGCLALWSRIVPHLGRAKLNFKDRIPTRPAAPPHSGLPVRSRDSHRRGQEAACAVEGLGCRARSPLSPGPGPVPTAALTQQQQLDLPRRLLAVLPEVAVDHLAALHGRLVLSAQCAAHGGRASPRPRRRGRLAERGEAGPEAAPLRPQLPQAGGEVC